MAYSDGEALVMTRLRTVAGFDANNTSSMHWGILNRGKSRQYAILKPGPWQDDDGRRSVTHWSTILEVWYRYKDDGTSGAGLVGLIEGIVNAIESYPHLGDPSKVLTSHVAKGSEVKEMWTRTGGGPVWLVTELTVEWQEETYQTYME